jgi:hypothetical protein
MDYQYLFCETKADLIRYLNDLGVLEKFPEQFIPFLVDIEWENLQNARIQAGLDKSTLKTT